MPDCTIPPSVEDMFAIIQLLVLGRGERVIKSDDIDSRASPLSFDIIPDTTPHAATTTTKN